MWEALNQLLSPALPAKAFAAIFIKHHEILLRTQIGNARLKGLTDRQNKQPDEPLCQFVMDIGFSTPAQIRGLVLPVGPIRTSQFTQYYDRLRSANEVRLVDLSPTMQSDNSFFNSKNYPNGRVLYNFNRFEDANNQEALFDIEIWRANLLVLGIAHYSSLDELPKLYKELRDRYPTLSSCQILVFGTPQDHSIDMGPHIVPVLSSNYTSLESAICDVTCNVFNNLNALAISKQLGSFKSPALKALDHSAALAVNKHPKKRHMPKTSSMSLSRTGSISMNVSERAKTRQKGRSIKFLGSLYLLTGKLSAALDTLSEAATVLKNAHDHLWFANTLEQIGICLVLQAFHELPVTIPTIAINTVEGETESFVARHAKLSQSQKLSDFLPNLMSTVLRFYDRCNPESEESVPYIVYQQSILRFASLLACLRRGGGWNSASMAAIVRNTILEPNITEHSPSITQIEEWCSLVVQNPSISPSELAIVKSLLSVYSYAGMNRKWAFTVQQLIITMATSGESEFIKQVPEQMLESLLGQLGDIYGAPKMKIACMRAFMQLATRMGQLKFVASVSCLMLAAGPDILSRDEQQQLYQVVRDDGEINHYCWIPDLLDNISLAASSSRRVRGPGSTSGATSTLSTSNLPNGGASTPALGAQPTDRGAIIYNPFTSVTVPEVSLIQNDPTPVKVYLRNPFAFELHVAEMYAVDTSDAKVSRVSRDISLPPKTISCAMLDLVPPSAGTLEVSGCWIQLSGCAAQVFRLQKNKSRGVKPKDPSPTTLQPLKLNVLSARPSLALRKIDSKSGWTMLLEGEQANVSVEISNTSSTASQILEFSFTDSTIDPLRQALGNAEATRSEIYELEFFLHERKAIEMHSASKMIEPHSTGTFDFCIKGKRGVSNATILVDSGSDQSTRIRIPMNVTVYPSIELDGIDIVPLSNESAIKGDLLVLLSLRNSWRQALDVTISTGKKSQTLTIESLRSQRFVLPIEWEFLPMDDLTKPIPSFTKKQYVVDTKTTREMLISFWLREKLLSKLSGKWASTDRSRCGEIEMRGIQLTRKITNILLVGAVDLTMSIKGDAKLDETYILYAKATNHSSEEKTGMLRIVPDRTNKSLVIGNLQRPIIIPPHTSVVVETSVVAICGGQVEWSSILDLIGGGQSFQRVPLLVNVH